MMSGYGSRDTGRGPRWPSTKRGNRRTSRAIQEEARTASLVVNSMACRSRISSTSAPTGGSVPTAKASQSLRSDEEDLARAFLRSKGTGHIVGTLPHVTLCSRVGRGAFQPIVYPVERFAGDEWHREHELQRGGSSLN